MSDITTNSTPVVPEEDDEITLIDLFAVLLRYRWMIIIGTALAAVLTFIYFFRC